MSNPSQINTRNERFRSNLTESMVSSLVGSSRIMRLDRHINMGPPKRLRKPSLERIILQIAAVTGKCIITRPDWQQKTREFS
jgi:hypothetical protein